MNDGADFFPAASIENLKARSRLLRAVRDFFHARGYWEVETPLLSHDSVVDPHIEPFVTTDADGSRLYLQTSPEFAMKRLLAAGAEAIFQLDRVFRRGEAGRLHNPEFTMIEWYRVGDTHVEQMQFTEELVLAVWRAGGHQPPESPFSRTSYRRAFERALGIDVFEATTSELAAIAREKCAATPDSMPADDRDGWLNLLLAELVEPQLGRDRPEFVFDYPASQAAIARIRPDDPPVAERFELYIDGIEICNGYHELTDAAELRRRIATESSRRNAAKLPELATSNRLLAAMDHGLPRCAGVALGFDRLVMLAARAESVADVIAFPIDRA